MSLTLVPIGVVRTPFKEKRCAPRQPDEHAGVRGHIVLEPGHGFEHALEDLSGWDYLWVLFWFHLNQGWKPKVLPPRSDRRRGLFATRSPYRPNPIGLSLVRLESVSELTLEVSGVDMLDGSPVLDLKPYLPYADARPRARTGWLEAPPLDEDAPADPRPAFDVVVEPLARTQLDFLRALGVDLEAAITQALSVGPRPHPYRRIRREGDAFRLAHKDWRVRFRVDGRRVTIQSLRTGYRPAQLAELPLPDERRAHRAFVEQFGGG